MNGYLGCGQYEAYILTRGGATLFSTIDLSSLAFTRVLDDTSEGDVTVDAACIGALSGTLPWRHELAIYRDGVLAWLGPVINPSAPVDTDHVAYDVKARGITAWWDRRRIHNDVIYESSTDLATIFQAISDDAMSVDGSPGLDLSTTPSGILGTLRVLASQHVMAGTQLRDLSKTGIDWTEIGRTVLAGGRVIPTAAIGVLRDEHFIAPPVPQIDGLQQTNSWVVRGNGSGDAGDSIYGVATDMVAGSADGVLESVDSVSTIEDNDSAIAAAQSRVKLTTGVISIQEAFLAPDAPVEFAALVPGALCELELTATSIPISGQFRLQKVSVQANGGGEERVGLTFQPPGQEA